MKDVNQSLIDDNLVCTDRVGIGCFFWALPSQGLNTRKILIEDFDKKIETTKADTEISAQKIEEAKAARDPLDGERAQMLKDLDAHRNKKAEL